MCKKLRNPENSKQHLKVHIINMARWKFINDSNFDENNLLPLYKGGGVKTRSLNIGPLTDV